MICLIVSIALHVALVFLVPLLPSPLGGSSTVDDQSDEQAGIDSLTFSTFDPDMTAADASGEASESPIAPLPVSNLTDLLEPTPTEREIADSDDVPQEAEDDAPTEIVPESLAENAIDSASHSLAEIDAQLERVAGFGVCGRRDRIHRRSTGRSSGPNGRNSGGEPTHDRTDHAREPVSTAEAAAATVPGTLESDFANRRGSAKEQALLRTGGDASTEAAVEAALRFLAEAQRSDGAWDPRASGAGKERAPLGTPRGGAGARAETAITGLALLTMIGAGNTHQTGDYADNVYRGLAYLIKNQHPSGSLAGNASVYAANYSHGMAALAMCEAAAITRDPSAMLSAQRAVSHTLRMQHPTTGGWRYTEGDPGDLSQLGWQAMVLDAGHRGEIPDRPASGRGSAAIPPQRSQRNAGRTGQLSPG